MGYNQMALACRPLFIAAKCSQGCTITGRHSLQPATLSTKKPLQLKSNRVLVPSASASDESIAVEGATTDDYGEPISLGTAKLPSDIDLSKLRTLLYQWATSLTQNANVPLQVPLKVDKVDDGMRLSYIRVNNGVVEDLVYINIIVAGPSKEYPQPMFIAERNGKLKNSVPPGEPALMQSLLAALKTSINMSR